MPLLTYQQARPWAKAIKAAVLLKQMPPWFADAHYGPYLNDKSLSQHDIETLVSVGYDAGAPEWKSERCSSRRCMARELGDQARHHRRWSCN